LKKELQKPSKIIFFCNQKYLAIELFEMTGFGTKVVLFDPETMDEVIENMNL